jgi:tetratricopeptide (TPR) repeat protein
MKHFCTILLFLLSLGLSAQIQRITQTTYEANSPSVWAKDFSVSYGIKPSVLDQLVLLYEKDGADSLARRRNVEKLIREFTLVAPKEQQKQSLSEADRQKLGISDQPAVAEALEWQLYTTGANSPAVYALGNVKIWYGIPKKAFLGVVAVLEGKQAQIEDFDKKLREQVEKFEELRAELAAQSDVDAVAKRAKQLLEEGNIAEAERILEEDFERDAKKLAYKAFELGEVKVLSLKYNEAKPYYQKAVSLDESNSKYLLTYGDLLQTIARYDEAIIYYQKALAVDTVAFKDQPEKVAVLYNNLGSVWYANGDYDGAIKK